MLAIMSHLKKVDMTTTMPSAYVPGWSTSLDTYLTAKGLKRQYFFGDFGGSFGGMFSSLPFHAYSFSEGYLFRGFIEREIYNGTGGSWSNVPAGTQVYIDTMKVMVLPDRPMVVSTDHAWTYSSYNYQDFTPVFTFRRSVSISYNTSISVPQTSKWVKDDEGTRTFPLPLLYILGGRYYYFDTRLTSTFLTHVIDQGQYGLYFEFDGDVGVAPIILSIRALTVVGSFNVIAGNSGRPVRWITSNTISPAGGACKLIVDASGGADILCSITRY